MGISVLEPVGDAMNRMGVVLFKPFDIKKWFVLGFCAFLAHLGDSGGSGSEWNFPGRGGGGGGGGTTPEEEMKQGLDWLAANLGLIVIVAVMILVVVLVISALVSWVKARGKFMLLDGVAHNRAAVVEPWKRYRQAGNSLFLFMFGIGVLFFVLIIGGLAMATAIAWPDIESQRVTSATWTAVVAGGGTFFALTIVIWVVGTILEDFVVPTMYLHNVGVLRHMGIALDELIAGHLGSTVLYLGMRFILSIAFVIVGVIATCGTCCIAAIPYIGTVILLPAWVFWRCYSLAYIEQFGPDWKVFVEPELEPVLPGMPPPVR